MIVATSGTSFRKRATRCERTRCAHLFAETKREGTYGCPGTDQIGVEILVKGHGRRDGSPNCLSLVPSGNVDGDHQGGVSRAHAGAMVMPVFPAWLPADERRRW